MEKSNCIQIINRLHELMIEANLSRPDDEVLDELNNNPSPDVDNFIKRIRFLKTKAKAQYNISFFENLQNEFNRLMNLSKNEISKLFTFEEEAHLQALYRNYKESSEKDKKSVMEDKRLLQLIQKAKVRVNNNLHE